MEYNYLVSPFDFDSFDNISKKQAQEYFEWYIAQSETRIGLLRTFTNEKNPGRISFDNSPESLVPLWDWFEDEILFGEQGVSSEPKDGCNTELPGEALKVILDISFYFAEVVLRNNPSIAWGYFTKPKSRMSVNKPVLVGFKADMDLDPRLIVRNCAYRSIDNKNSENLFNIYTNWLDLI